jgi:hypothetical protein
MPLNLQNKVTELCAHIHGRNACEEEFGEPDVRRLVLRRWPELATDIQEQIVQAVMRRK